MFSPLPSPHKARPGSSEDIATHSGPAPSWHEGGRIATVSGGNVAGSHSEPGVASQGYGSDYKAHVKVSHQTQTKRIQTRLHLRLLPEILQPLPDHTAQKEV